MAKKVRLTNFARFFIFLIIVVPLAYLGASYVNGEDPKENINKLLNKEILSTDSKPTIEDNTSNTDDVSQSGTQSNELNQVKIEELQSEVNFYKSKVDELKDKVEKLEKENYKLRQNQ